MLPSGGVGRVRAIKPKEGVKGFGRAPKPAKVRRDSQGSPPKTRYRPYLNDKATEL
jgi:hypothetical protein